MKVKALKNGFDGQSQRKAGEVFHWPVGVPLGRWVQPITAEVVRPKPQTAAVKPPVDKTKA